MKTKVCVTLATLCALAASAQAASLDDQGKLALGEHAYGFEDLDALDVRGYGANGRAIELKLEETPEGLEGERALRIGGADRQALVRLEETFPFAGKRVRATIWTRAHGAELRAHIRWFSGDVDRFLMTGDARIAAGIGYLAFEPTGRATSDGWVEMSTGAFDWELGGLKEPATLSIYDNSHLASFFQRGSTFDPEAYALVDGLEFEIVGDAAVPQAECRVGQEDELCGEMGACHLGQCVDAAAVFGQAPLPSVRTSYLERLGGLLENFSAIRGTRDRIPAIKTAWRDLLDTESPRTFWQGLSMAHEQITDGHGRAPGSVSFGVQHSAGICLGPGQADLLPGDPDALVPMVFSTDTAQFNVSRLVQPGDVLREVDGIPYAEWAERMRPRHYYNGDPGGRDVIFMLQVMNIALRGGSTLTFERCNNMPDAQPMGCMPNEVERIEIDLRERYAAPHWVDQPINPFTQQTCDFRFNAEVQRAANEDLYFFAGWRDVDEVRHVVFNGVPSPQGSQQGQRWGDTMERALSSAPPMLVLDQRTGYGGNIDAVAYIIGQLYQPANNALARIVPWLSEPLDDVTRGAFETCLTQLGSVESCGNYYIWQPTEFFSVGGSRDSRVALLNGLDVSGNDYLAKYITYRAAPTRIFGYAPTMGAYGVSCQFPSLIGELQPMSYQCHDSQFIGPDGRSDGYESGTGVPSDETVYQKQSDALLGVDTIIARATAWLKQTGEP